jgi:hypothetical protein
MSAGSQQMEQMTDTRDARPVRLEPENRAPIPVGFAVRGADIGRPVGDAHVLDGLATARTPVHGNNPLQIAREIIGK